MKKNLSFDDLFCVLPFIILLVSFAVSVLFGEPHIFGNAGISRYSWIMWLFAPVLLVPILYGFKKKKKNEPYLRYLVIPVLVLPFLLMIGASRFAFADIHDYSTDCLASIERCADVEIPDQVKMVTDHYEDMQGFAPYYISRIKIMDAVQADAFEKTMAQDDRWVSDLPADVFGLLPGFHQMELREFDFFMFYNITTHTYNTVPTQDYNNCILLAYNDEISCLFVIHDLVLQPAI